MKIKKQTKTKKIKPTQKKKTHTKRAQSLFDKENEFPKESFEL